MKTFTIPVPTYKAEVLFVVDCTHQELDRYLRRRFRCDAGDFDNQVGQMFTFDRAPWRVVWVRDWSDKPVLFHEVFHLVTRICHDKNIPIRALTRDHENGDEAAAYLFEYFATKLLNRK